MTPSELVEFAEALARISAAGAGAKAFADVLAKRAHVGVLIEDAHWRRLATAGNADVPGSVRPLIDEGHGSELFSPLRNGYAGRTISIAAAQERFGQLSIFGTRDLDALEPLVRLTASAIAVAMAREYSAQPVRRRAFWERLASGAYQDAAAARDDAAARGIPVASHYVAIALEAEVAEDAIATRNQAALRAAANERFKRTEGDVGCIERGSTLLYFVPAQREVEAANARTGAAMLSRASAKGAPPLRIAGGVGNRVPLIELHTSLSQAETALSIVRRMYGAGRVGVYEDLGIYPLLLCGAAAPELQAFAARTLAALRAYDEKHQTELERTLRLYFEVGENVKTAASHLNVHRHTVFYRLRQIGEICGCSFSDPHDQLTLRTAIAIDALFK
ncbi:MAG TPA: helix-turn-helix domain-containing protein [Candidatus Baltobacteraceae bacterium]|jgi:sugar diacid utilization regulator|nr:helix-turn-helix domain-containing protein [Candidatus Baltobacteraceae bacterium]